MCVVLYPPVLMEYFDSRLHIITKEHDSIFTWCDKVLIMYTEIVKNKVFRLIIWYFWKQTRLHKCIKWVIEYSYVKIHNSEIPQSSYIQCMVYNTVMLRSLDVSHEMHSILEANICFQAHGPCFSVFLPYLSSNIWWLDMCIQFLSVFKCQYYVYV